MNRKFGEFMLLRRLALGGQSEVFLALKMGPQTFSRLLVIKALPAKFRDNPRYLELFYQEAFISARFDHPNLISVHDARQIGDEHFMVMDFVSGQTVADIAQRGFARGEPLDLNMVVQIVADACHGLQYVHQFRDLDDQNYAVVHCDVSPQNLMVTYDGVTKVFDFGIARVTGEGPGGIRRTSEGDAAETAGGGKYAYMSPEQCMGKPVDARSDLFSLGIILYELSTGFRLFRRATTPDVIRAVTEGPIEPPGALNPDLPPFLERCILRALERDPDARYQSAAEFREDLQQYLAMASNGRTRAALGEHVSRMFDAERREIADTIRKAESGEIALTTTSSSSGLWVSLPEYTLPPAEESMELERPEFGPTPAGPGGLPPIDEPLTPIGLDADSAIDPSPTDEVVALNDELERASHRADALLAEIDRLERRNSNMNVILGILAVLVVVAAMHSYLLERFAPGAGETIEVTAERGE